MINLSQLNGCGSYIKKCISQNVLKIRNYIIDVMQMVATISLFQSFMYLNPKRDIFAVYLKIYIFIDIFYMNIYIYNKYKIIY